MCKLIRFFTAWTSSTSEIAACNGRRSPSASVKVNGRLREPSPPCRATQRSREIGVRLSRVQTPRVDDGNMRVCGGS
eukprot:6198863-Pleurochrysis_carterae.AAC.1